MAAEDSLSVDLPGALVPVSEHQNRSRNLVARVRFILRQMADADPSASEFAAHLEGRLSALWRAEEVFARNGSDLELIILDELETLRTPVTAMTLHGPPVQLDPKVASVVILAIHELATNALKFGALGSPEGHVAITWFISQEQAGPLLQLKWVESGVSLIALAPRRHGFGHDLITRRIAYELGGAGEFVWNPGGVTSLIKFPLQA